MEKGHWYTDENGHHYFVKEGQSPKEGWESTKRRKMINGGKYQTSEDGKNWKDSTREEYEKYEADEMEFDKFDLDEDEKEKKESKPTEGLLDHDDNYKYQLLDRMRQDAEYYKTNKADKYLWSGFPEQHITDMRALYNSLKEKPEWLTEEDINEYERMFKEELNSMGDENPQSSELKKNFKDTPEQEYRKWNMGSDKNYLTEEEYNKLDSLRARLVKEGLPARLDEGYEDYGANMKWKNISVGSTWGLNPNEWIDFMNNDLSEDELVNTLKDRFKDKIKKSQQSDDKKFIPTKQTIWDDPNHPLYSISPSEQNEEFLTEAIKEMQKYSDEWKYYEKYRKNQISPEGKKELDKKLNRYKKALDYIRSGEEYGLSDKDEDLIINKLQDLDTKELNNPKGLRSILQETKINQLNDEQLRDLIAVAKYLKRIKK